MKALIIVDLQNDFAPGGALAVREGDQIAPITNALMPLFQLVIATKDWHPENHRSFASQHAGKTVGDLIQLQGLDQVLWPNHCIQNSKGADFVPDLDSAKINHIFYKGTDREIDSYSAFFDNARKKSTGLDTLLKENGVDELYILGLATDYCVKFSVMDALSLGFKTHVIVDACRGVNLAPGDSEKAIEEMKQAGAQIVTHDTLILESLLPATPKNARVGILGGSFDPPHLSHQLLALSALALEPIDELWVIPCADHPFRKNLSPFQHRLAMCEIAFARINHGVHVVPIEKYLPAPNYTVRTLEAILSLRPDLRLVLTMGSDILEQVPKWHEPNRLEQLSEIIVYLREGFPVKSIPSQMKKARIHDGYILPDIQSSRIREFIKKDDSKAGLAQILSIDQKVVSYINSHYLYR